MATKAEIVAANLTALAELDTSLRAVANLPRKIAAILPELSLVRTGLKDFAYYHKVLDELVIHLEKERQNVPGPVRNKINALRAIVNECSVALENG